MENALEEKIRQLAAEKLAGIISEDDLEEFNVLLAGNPEARDLWASIQASLTQLQINELNTEQAIEDTFVVIEKRRAIKKKIQIGAAFTIGMIGCALALYFWPRPQSALPVVDTSNGVVLMLSSGKEVSLTSGQASGQIKLGSSSFVNDSGALKVNSNAADEQATMKVPVGMDYKLELSDGTKVTVNSASEISFPVKFSKDRVIYFHGEGYFDVAPLANKPFTIILPEGKVEVLGTSLNIHAYSKELESVSLINGSIRVTIGKDTLIPKVGYSVISEQSKNSIRLTADDELSWMRGIYFLDRADIQEVATILQRAYPVHVYLDNPAIEKKRINAVIEKSKPIEEFLNNLKEFEIEYYIKGDEVHLR